MGGLAGITAERLVGARHVGTKSGAWKAWTLGALTVIGSHLPQGPADRGARHHHGGRAPVVAHRQVQPEEGR